ncbi:metal ABC transporter ATP-binding protein [Bifidobacterium actinocoloniiforme DSM 22766]|uniref:Metal ABC transporter ATP-binding protein n=1 Tax=Bifidobacterium actinocoloniiforme DSM 22766 TaxID=1437605 RepID=A0A086Z037_9BIFI|nr:ABC transporter ATP-binding protein [Bifidobacterium actinocoloniiforme]AKV55151.1 ABC transporter ATP-binding protein [Bifidobacterium actinocoloniiforme DSM 22766]KFI39887.1 metal ABC transporter ATP-binding protein [Bifidobacterium actinocoloniiforme DSM 22766]
MQTDSKEEDAIVLVNAAARRGGREIWSHGSFTIPSGTITAIVGTNGAGKTTLMQTELGLLPLAAGSIQVLGQPAGKESDRIGYVPQSYTSEVDANLTVEQSVLLGVNGTRFGARPTSSAERRQAHQAMTFTGIEDRANSRLSELSGGLRQRVAIAQALACDPLLLMLDEPLANLDLASQRETVHVLARLNRQLGMTIQVVAHDLNMLLPILDGAVYLLDGHPHYAGIHDLLDSDLLTHLYGTQVEVVSTPQGEMFISPSTDETAQGSHDLHRPTEIVQEHHHQARPSAAEGRRS